MARITISTAYMCFRSASEVVYSWRRARAEERERGMGESGER
jgi:hypothetical protein